VVAKGIIVHNKAGEERVIGRDKHHPQMMVPRQ
jgi:hypothetical protein